MSRHLYLYRTHEDYLGNPPKEIPNINLCLDHDDPHYDILGNKIIYRASSKLAETTSNKNSGFHNYEYDADTYLISLMKNH